MNTQLQKHSALLSLYFTLFLSHAFAQDYYVSALSGSDSNTGLSTTTAFATIQKGADMVGAGGTVFIMNGVYNKTTNGAVLNFTKSGTSSAYITFKPYPGHNPVISASGDSWDAVIINGSYVILDGLEFKGINANLTLSGANNAYLQSYGNPAVYNANYNTNGIVGVKNPTTTPHHIIVRNCKVHDFPGNGITFGPCDYVTVEGNTVYNNSWYTMYATSGISIFGPKPMDAVTTYKIFIRGNICHNNFTQVKWRRGNQSQDIVSDGNGIILDANNGTQGKPVYTGRTLVENNVSYNNGGGGIHAFQAARVDIINNTAYNNGTIVGYPEIDGQSGTDVKIYNNIMYARSGGNCNGNDAGATYNYNIYFNGPAYKKGADDIVADPQFVKLAFDATADFRLKSTSPAINTGSNLTGQYSTKDILGVNRPVGTKPDRGAYEYSSIATGVTTLSKNENVYNVYPNPATDYVFFEGVQCNSVIELYDVLGRKVFNLISNVSNTKIDISGLEPAIYFYKIINDGNTSQTGKLIKE
ncbi:MAG: T9SS type A sorting domain-containing protein [Bacteroidetes bacterium]|nr:T9SS type A sorting domain-containing protein [Bacteroidota bacterium]